MRWVVKSARHIELFDGDKAMGFTICTIGMEDALKFEAWDKRGSPAVILACNLPTKEAAMAVVKETLA